MSNVVKFSKTKKAIPAKPILDVTHRYVEHKHRRVQFLPWNMVLNVLIFLIGCLRTIALTLLLWFRPILFVAVRPLSGLLLISRSLSVCSATQTTSGLPGGSVY